MRRLSGRGRLSADQGYTLTEMLVVIGVIGLIAVVLTPNLVGQLGRARAKTAQMQVETVAAAVETFRSDVSRYPTDGEGLNALMGDPGNVDGWVGPYLKNPKQLQDPWGNAITYKLAADGRTFTITSLGRDAAAGGFGLDKDLTAPN